MKPRVRRLPGAPRLSERFALLWHDPTLRMLVLASIGFGAFACTVGIFQSLIAVTIFGLTDAQFAVVMAAVLVVSVSASLGVGILTDQRPSRRLMAILATATMILGGAIVLIGQNTVAFVVAHALLLPLAGTFFGQIFAVARLVLAPHPREVRDGAITVIRAAFALPFVVILPLWSLAFALGAPVLSIYPAVIVFGGALLALIALRWPPDAQAPWQEVKSGKGFVASMAEILRPTVFVRVMLIGAIHLGGALSGVLVGLIFFEAPGRGAADVSLFFGLFVALEVVVTLQVYRILKYMRRLYVIALGVLIYASFIALLPFMAESPAVWVLVFPAGIGGAFIYALAIGYLQDLLGMRAGAGSSLIALQRIGSDGVAAAIFALGSWLAGYWLVALAGAFVMLAAMAAILWLDRFRPFDA